MIEMTWQVPDDVQSELRAGGPDNVQKLLRKVLRYFHRVARPTVIGPISLESGVSLRQLQMLVDFLVASGDLRLASDKETRELGVPVEAAVYTLAQGAKVWLAHD